MDESHLTLLEKYINKYYPNVNGSDFITLIDIIYMAAVRNSISIPTLLDDLYKGILDIDGFSKATHGNIYDFIKEEYRSFAVRIKDITVGSNGGMANVGKGEWLISLCSGIDQTTDKPRAVITKKGVGDIQYFEKNEEVKWNGGKVCIEIAGNLVNQKFNKLIDIEDKFWVPFRMKDKTKYSDEVIQMYNGVYWTSISGETSESLTDDDLKKKIINGAFRNVFEKSNSFIMFNDDGKFQRFCNADEANEYYDDKPRLLKGSKMGFECRAKQPNPIALYCHVF